MDATDARQIVREHLQQYVTDVSQEIWVGEIIDQNELGYTIEAGLYAPGMPENSNAVWFEVDAVHRTVEMCMIG